jgi:hypothetical protein
MYTIGVDFPVQKRCADCETIKPRSEFLKSAMRPDGLQVRCRPCALAYSAEPFEFTDPIRCTTCRQVRPGSHFKDVSFRGLWRCVFCRKEYDRARYRRLLKSGKCYRHKNRDALLGRSACAECLERDRAHSRARRLAKKNASPVPLLAGPQQPEKGNPNDDP